MIDEKKFLSDLQSDNADTRFAAWRAAGDTSPGVIPELGKIASSSDPGVAKAGREALTSLTHTVGKDVNAPNRAGVVQGLLALAGDGNALPVRVHAVRLLSNIGGDDAVPGVAKLLSNAHLREEAVYALEQIPGEASIDAIVAACKTAPDDFKPRLLAALGHRRSAKGMPLCVEAFKSPNAGVVVAAIKAAGRIGAEISPTPQMPNMAKLTPFQQAEVMDAMLRYADAMAAGGNAADAMRLYRMAVNSPAPHLQCAGAIGMAKIGTAEAASAILPLTKSGNKQVKIVAQNAWKSMAAGK